MLILGLLALSGLSYLLYKDLIESADEANQRVIEGLAQERGQLSQLGRTIARLGQVQRGIQFREVRATESFFREITPNLNLDRIYLIDRDGRIITEYPKREEPTEV